MPREKEVHKTITDDMIRHTLDTESGTYYYSVVDAIGILTGTTDGRNYWKVLKNRLKKSVKKDDRELVSVCNQLKLPASDGKSYLTDTADSSTLIEIMRIVAPSDIAPLVTWITHREHATTHRKRVESSPEGMSYPQHDSDTTSEGELTIDMYESETAFIVETSVAGVPPEHLMIAVTIDTLTIKGSRRAPDHAATKYFSQELFWGTFSRSITLPSLIEIDRVHAHEVHGLLTITLPKINISRVRQIKIS